jgi:hypothetical protein
LENHGPRLVGAPPQRRGIMDVQFVVDTGGEDRQNTSLSVTK